MTEWKVNPTHGDFNPGTKLGTIIFQEKTQGLPSSERFDLEKKNSNSIHKFLKAREGQMGTVVTAVPTAYDANNVATKTANLLTQYQGLTLDQLQRVAHRRCNVAIADADPIPAAPFTAKALDPANSAGDKKLL